MTSSRSSKRKLKKKQYSALQELPNVLVVLGPTASGKSELAVTLALRLRSGQAKKRYGIKGAEIISADSRQIYKGLDIGSGKVPGKWRNAKGNMSFVYKGIRHHMIDFVNPRRQYSAAQYQKSASKILYTLLANGYLPIVCGGTGFYIDALLSGSSFPAAIPNPKLRRTLEKQSASALFAQLRKLDPQRAKTIDRHNKRRLIRAIEIVRATGNQVPSLISAEGGRARLPATGGNGRIREFDVLKIGIQLPSETLRVRIHERLMKRLRQGMIAEVKKLHTPPPGGSLSWKRLDDLGLEYRYVSHYLRGTLTKEKMTRTIEYESWHYAKRQMTWWRRDKDIAWCRNEKEALRAANRFLRQTEKQKEPSRGTGE